MTLRDRLNEDMKTAMKAKDKYRLGIIRMMKNEIAKREIDERRDLTEDEAIAAITGYKKVVTQQLEYAETAEDTEKAAEFKAELAIVNEYLPEQLTAEGVEALIKSLIEQHGFSGAKDKGNLMKVLMPEVKGKADGKLVNETVSKLLV
ncbi:MAG: GatB/YqeY domain-containing protein [Gorillibacterium sp.]|nr:GatB/YqeY domain-containing protein [Gorillibacterium sp.]